MRSTSTSSANLHAFQTESMQLLTGIMDIDRSASYLIDGHGKLVCFKVHQVQAAMHHQYLENFYQYDPLHPCNLDESDISIVKTNDLVSPYDRNSHPYYHDFMSPWGIKDTVEMYLHFQGKPFAGFALFIDERQRELLSNDLQKLEQMRSYMQFSLEQILTSSEQQDFDGFCSEHKLTPKEKMVVELIVLGLPNKSIANQLCCSLATVKTHLQHIFDKLQVNSKGEVASKLYHFKTRH